MKEKERERISEIENLDFFESLDVEDEVKIILHNDDTTPAMFVVALLHTVFAFDESKAFNVMLKANREGTALVGTYTYEVAESKLNEAFAIIKSAEVPLRLSLEE